MRDRLVSSAIVVAGMCVSAACAHHRPASPVDRFFLHKEAKVAAQRSESTSQGSLEEADKLRQLIASARPSPRGSGPTLETTDPVLAAALKDLAVTPTAENLYEVGAAYHRRGLFDQAYTHYSRSLRLHPHHGPTHEALARLWRDAGLPQLGLGDVHRAIYYAPESATARNTLGTVLQALGLRDDARNAYKMAFRLDGKAGYAFNNLCYLSFVEGKAAQAIDECQAALRLDPSLSAAHNNLALIYAAVGRVDLARREFAVAGPAVYAAYNLGIVYLAQNRYSDAAREFEAASEGRPSLVDAPRRARDARRRAEVERPNRGGQ